MAVEIREVEFSSDYHLHGSELNCDLRHVISAGLSEFQLSDSSDADQMTEAERSRDVKIYIPYESAELCITQVK